MAIAFVPPETKRIALGDGQDGSWILVKKRLNAGETRRLFAGVIAKMEIGEKPQLDPAKVGVQKIVVYLLDWSAADVFPIRGKSSAEIEAAVNALDPDSYQQISNAIDAHEAEMEAEAALQKKAMAGETGSSATSPSAA